ncbi:MAG: ABC transporter permease [Acidimicrobiaceae bacterium]|nr:ABC transporter permease [Acidimicrobiaceae bacterium]
MDGTQGARGAGLSPSSGLVAVRRHRDMIRELAVTEFKLKYQGSVLGYIWSIVKPLLMFAVLYIVFTHVVKLGANIPHYAQQLLLGIVLWTFFTDSTVIAISSIVDRGELIRKVHFPRIVIPVSTSVSALITLVLNFVVVLAFIVAGGVSLRPSGLMLLPLLIEFYVLALGCSLLLAALYVRFRDFKHIWEVLIQALFYATPIIYPLSILPGGLATLFALSPIAQIVEDARWALISPAAETSGEVLHWPLLLVPYLFPVVVLAIGYRYFESAAAGFAEEI